MASRPGLLYNWPWRNDYTKYLLVLSPFVGACLLGKDDDDDWCFHMACLALLRLLHGQLWVIFGRSSLYDKWGIYSSRPDYKQVDRESDWDNMILLQAILSSIVHWMPGLGMNGFPRFNSMGLLQLLVWHCGPAEFVYYWLHRLLHEPALFKRFHSHHHRSITTEPITGSVHPFGEHLLYAVNFAIPMVGTWMVGGASIAMFYIYMLGFDFMNNLGHLPFELAPMRCLYKAFPPLFYLVYNPSFHSLHHTRFNVNYSLFMPLYDWIYNTFDASSFARFESASNGEIVSRPRPNCVFLAHGTDLTSVFHLPWASHSFSAHPYSGKNLALAPLAPLAAILFVIFRLMGRVLMGDRNFIRRENGERFAFETWVVPALGFQYFLPFEKGFINSRIVSAIRQADAVDAGVVGLGALNKSEPLNEGGKALLDAGLNPRARIVHGNTLTAAAIIKMLPDSCERVFLVGGTSKIGRAVALYLARKGVEVHLQTASEERFSAIASELAEEHEGNLMRCRTLSDGSSLSNWLVGKYLTPKQQMNAPSGALFVQFAVPELKRSRRNCTYTNVPAFRLPREKTTMKSCEMTMPRHCVHACHAGALVHCLEGFQEHEVGGIDPDEMDVYWEAAIRHGMALV